MDAEAQKREMLRLLAEPFPPEAVKFKPAVVKDGRAMALAYVDARDIQDRLDAVMGVDGWEDVYEQLQNGSVMCKLRLHIGDKTITKSDVGGESEQPDEGDRTKAAFSDALKRTAVKFGIGRYLYRLPQQWCEYDPQRRRFVNPPKLPAAALPPRTKPQPQAQPTPQPAKETERAEQPQQATPPAQQQSAKPQLPQQGQGDPITRHQANEIVLALKAAGVVNKEARDGVLKGSTDCRGLLRFYRHALLREITFGEYQDALARIKASPQDFAFKEGGSRE